MKDPGFSLSRVILLHMDKKYNKILPKIRLGKTTLNRGDQLGLKPPG